MIYDLMLLLPPSVIAARLGWMFVDALILMLRSVLATADLLAAVREMDLRDVRDLDWTSVACDVGVLR